MNPRKHAAERDEEILRAIRSYRHPVQFHSIAKKVKQARSYLAERLRVMASDGRLHREKYNDKDYLYRIPT